MKKIEEINVVKAGKKSVSTAVNEFFLSSNIDAEFSVQFSCHSNSYDSLQPNFTSRTLSFSDLASIATWTQSSPNPEIQQQSQQQEEKNPVFPTSQVNQQLVIEEPSNSNNNNNQSSNNVIEIPFLLNTGFEIESENTSPLDEEFTCMSSSVEMENDNQDDEINSETTEPKSVFSSSFIESESDLQDAPLMSLTSEENLEIQHQSENTKSLSHHFELPCNSRCGELQHAWSISQSFRPHPNVLQIHSHLHRINCCSCISCDRNTCSANKQSFCAILIENSTMDLNQFLGKQKEIANTQATVRMQAVLKVFQQIAIGLDHLHRNSIAHTNLNFKNVLILEETEEEEDDFSLKRFTAKISGLEKVSRVLQSDEQHKTKSTCKFEIKRVYSSSNNIQTDFVRNSSSLEHNSPQSTFEYEINSQQSEETSESIDLMKEDVYRFGLMLFASVFDLDYELAIQEFEKDFKPIYSSFALRFGRFVESDMRIQRGIKMLSCQFKARERDICQLFVGMLNPNPTQRFQCCQIITHSLFRYA